MPGSLISRVTCASLALLASAPSRPQSAAVVVPPAFPSQETLWYGAEWRLIYAGTARLSLEPGPGTGEWRANLHMQSAGLVSKLYKLNDAYEAAFQDQFCATSVSLDAVERSRHHETKVTFDGAHGKASYLERDVLKNSVFKTAEIEIPPCVSDIIGALHKLRTLKLDPGQSGQIPISDGKKSAVTRVEAQQREQIKTKAGVFSTIRYEAFVFNGVLYARKAQLLIWLTSDARRLPVQIRVRLSFPVGSITLQLEKEEHS